MEARELRFGNYIRYFKKDVSVLLLKKEGTTPYIGCSFDIKSLIYSYNEQDAYDGIPITNDWLVKLGFKRNPNDYFELRANELLCFTKSDLWEYLFVSFDHEDDIEFEEIAFKHIKFVHQLQNLYFALTGLELTLPSPQQQQD